MQQYTQEHGTQANLSELTWFGRVCEEKEKKGFQEGEVKGLQEGMKHFILKQIEKHFVEILSEEQKTKLNEMTFEQLEIIGEKVFTAKSLQELF